MRYSDFLGISNVPQAEIDMVNLLGPYCQLPSQLLLGECSRIMVKWQASHPCSLAADLVLDATYRIKEALAQLCKRSANDQKYSRLTIALPEWYERLSCSGWEDFANLVYVMYLSVYVYSTDNNRLQALKRPMCQLSACVAEDLGQKPNFAIVVQQAAKTAAADLHQQVQSKSP